MILCQSTLFGHGKKNTPSFVKKYGSVEDIAARLPPETNNNQPKKPKDRSEAIATYPHHKPKKVAARTSKERSVDHNEASDES